MHGQSAEPSHTQQRDEEGRGGRRDGGVEEGGQGRGETKTFGLICRSGNSFGMFSLHGCAGESTTV